jgi:hypothetical protein
MESPFKKYCDAQDKYVMINNASHNFYESQAEELYKHSPGYITEVFEAEAHFRAKTFNNEIISIEGQQGTFKSIFGAALSQHILCPAFKQPLDPKTFFSRWYCNAEELDEKIRVDDYKTVHVLDEQKKAVIGKGSVSANLRLSDYEDQCRKTQKSIIYISPEIFDHSHYFVFKSHSTPRLQNPLCELQKNGKCTQGERINECFSHETKTLCSKVKFNQRTGFPESIIFRLYTDNLYTGRKVCRGFLEIEPPSPEIFAYYFNIVKPLFLNKLEKNIDFLHSRYTKLTEGVIKAHLIELIIISGHKSVKKIKLKQSDGSEILEDQIIDTERWVSANKSVIEAKLYEFEQSTRKWTISQIEYLVDNIKHKLDLICQEKNLKKGVSKN